jgi:hypothetical protein
MMEARIQEAIQYMNGFPDAKITAVAKDFGVSRWSLRRRLEGVGPKKGSKKATPSLRKLKKGLSVPTLNVWTGSTSQCSQVLFRKLPIIF